MPSPSGTSPVENCSTNSHKKVFRAARGIAFSPDGTMLATVDKQGCCLWDAATGKELRLLKGEGLNLDKVAFAPDGKTVAASNRRGTVPLWDTATGALLRSIECNQEFPLEVVFSPDGKRLASGGIDGSVCLWDPLTGKEILRLQTHLRVVKVLFTPDGKRLLSSGHSLKDTIREWDVGTGRELRAFGEVRRCMPAMALLKDGSLLANGEMDGRIRLWDMATGQEKRHWSSGSTPVWGLAFSPDGKTLASAAWDDSSVRFWDVATGREQHPSPEHLGGISILRFFADGKTLVSVSPDRRMVWWDVTEHLPRRRFAWKALGEEYLVALSPDGNLLADISRLRPPYGSIQLWDVRAEKPGLLLGGSKKGPAGRGAFSPDGRLLASGGGDLVLTLWDVRDGKAVRQIKGLPVPETCLCFSPDGKDLAVGLENSRGTPGARTLRLYDVVSGEEKRTFDVHETITGLTFSPDGKVLAAGNGNGYPQDAFVRLLDVKTGSELCRHEGHRDCEWGDRLFCPTASWSLRDRDRAAVVARPFRACVGGGDRSADPSFRGPSRQRGQRGIRAGWPERGQRQRRFDDPPVGHHGPARRRSLAGQAADAAPAGSVLDGVGR